MPVHEILAKRTGDGSYLDEGVGKDHRFETILTSSPPTSSRTARIGRRLLVTGVVSQHHVQPLRRCGAAWVVSIAAATTEVIAALTIRIVLDVGVLQYLLDGGKANRSGG